MSRLLSTPQADDKSDLLKSTIKMILPVVQSSPCSAAHPQP
jgi:hypothetical protein